MELLITSAGFGLFIVCPRMAAMMHIIHKNTNTSMFLTVLLGILFSIPIMLLMVAVFNKFGVWGALILCVATDFGAAFIMKEISIKAGVETFIVALFVIIGVKLAPLISGLFLKK
ncbi:MAG: hypothetical protein U9N62_03710 [Thermotogota bacterium]|nr:hypothetical protein [Thermotogota bacterium]